MLTEAGRQIPEWWQTDRFTREQKKALLRCLIDKVVVHRTAPDRVHCRVVWKGGETTDADVAVTVGSWSRLSKGREIEESILRLARQGKSDEEIARYLTERGHHSPRHTTVLLQLRADRPASPSACSVTAGSRTHGRSPAS